jgi:predicted RNA-binding Zn-ribbon protein involved in translation (DUF1610 family)
MRSIVYYCPRCDRTIPKDKAEEISNELVSRFGDTKLASLRCPVCDTSLIDLDKVRKGGEQYVGKTRQGSKTD